MRRREFLGLAAGAGVLGALWRPSRRSDVATDSSWTKSYYGTDLKWSVNQAFSSLVTVGNGSAFLLWRRINGIFFYSMGITIGSTTSFPSSAQWYFEFPNVFSNVSDTNVVFPVISWSGTGAATVAAASDTAVGVAAQVVRPGYGSVVLPSANLYALDFDTGSGALTKVFPGAWAAGDYLSLNGWVPCLDN